MQLRFPFSSYTGITCGRTDRRTHLYGGVLEYLIYGSPENCSTQISPSQSSDLAMQTSLIAISTLSVTGTLKLADPQKGE
jgi:hypothetical protein